VAAWVAWSAVQQQIKDERERALADRREAERLLVDDLTDYADVMAAGWRLLVDLPEKADESLRHRVFDGVAFMAKHLSRPEQIANYRAMADILGWDRRRRYNALVRGLEGLGQFDSAERITDPDEPLRVIRSLSHDFEYCLPDADNLFAGLWRRYPKAMSTADWVRRIGGADKTAD
jgi:hypothetical protein